MSLLLQLQQLGADVIHKVKAQYGTFLPIEVRYCFSEFLENRLV